MKKRIVSMLLSAVLLTATGCSNPESSKRSPEESSQITAVVQPAEPAKLVNKMTANELARVEKHGLTLLDEPEAQTKPETDQTAHTVGIEFMTLTPEMMKEQLADLKKRLSEEDYRKAEEEIRPIMESAKPYRLAAFFLVDGKRCTDYVPYSDEKYDGGAFTFSNIVFDPDTNESKREEFSFESMEKYLEWIRQHYTELGYSADWAERAAKRVEIASEALRTGNYETLAEGTVNAADQSLYDLEMSEKKSDYRDVWEYDRAAVGAIKESVDEISIYDDELETVFLVHVTLPPHYDPAKTYPVFFLTDGVWRFGNVPDLRRCMENGEAADVLLVTLGLGYQYDGTDLSFRYQTLVRSRYALLDFITDNLMPYLSEQYPIDFANSTLFGHSDGGVFAHTALCKSDQYTNQPFGKYIIGSPAFWGLYYGYPDLDADAYEKDYGCFDRNDTLQKQVFLCGGKLEDPDYADSYNGHPTTLEGLAALNERLTAHGTAVTYQLYDSHHYQYIPDMLTEYLKTTYPPAN